MFIDEVIFIPLPTGKLLLKGVDKEASVKVIITKKDLKDQEVIWIIDDLEIVEVETQGVIAKFHSIKRGSTKVTIKVGDYSSSFTLYVTNIRGDID